MELPIQHVSDFIDNGDDIKKIIYFGVGSHFNGNLQDISNYWKDNENQQFPLFIHDHKINNIDDEMIIILIDPSIKNPPYIVTDSTSFYADSWSKDEIYDNIFKSSFGITVIVYQVAISWEEIDKRVNIFPILINTCKIVNKYKNYLLFYHEFYGSSPIILENKIKEVNGAYNPHKVCIDITRGGNLSCYFDLSDPFNYPIIAIENDCLIYKNPEYLSKEEICIINSKFTNININSVNKKDNDYILFQQIKNSLKFIKNICKNYVISLLRNHLIKNKLDDKMYQLIMIKNLIIKIPLLNININNLIQYIRIMDDQNITKELFNIFKIIINHLMFYYNFNSSDIESLLYLMNNDSNKYNLLKYFNDFEEKFMN